ncbi:hypothetical protein HMI56_002274 [Coelomomyces lativittatus]|nr:hypothetical protein HMI56_002274 [Coelomomyces lativittatus]
MSSLPCYTFEPKPKDLYSSPNINQRSHFISFHPQIGKEKEPIKRCIQIYPPHRVESRFGGLMRSFREWKEKQLATSSRMNSHLVDMENFPVENGIIKPKLIDSSEYECSFSQESTSSYSSEYSDDDEEEEEEGSNCSYDSWSELNSYSKREIAMTERRAHMLTFRLKNILGIK